MSVEPVLVFDRVALITGGARLFDQLDVTVGNGERVAIVGDSGDGKSTISRLALGLIPPLSGRVRLFGAAFESLDPDQRRALRARCGVALQGGSLLSSLSVEENLWLGLSVAARHRLRRKLDRVMLEFAIEHAAATPVGALSTGERRRVELARAFMRDPELVILDEPLEGAQSRAGALERLIYRQTATRGRALLLLTQDVRLAQALCERVYVITRGRLVQQVETAPAGEPAIL